MFLGRLFCEPKQSACPTPIRKHRLVKEGNETVTDCNRLKMIAQDGKMCKTDVADTQQLLRLIQSVPSPKAEPFKVWLAKRRYAADRRNRRSRTIF